VTTGLNLPISDLNIQVNLKFRHYNDRLLRVAAMSFINALSSNKALAEQVLWDEKKGLFIVKIQLSTAYQSFRVEVIFRIFNHLTFPKNEEVVERYLEFYPHARPLYLIIRSLIHRAGLDDPGQHGINNFSLFLMIIAFCQKAESLSVDQSSTLAQQQPAELPNTQTGRYSKEGQKAQTKSSGQSGSSRFGENTGDLLIKFFYFYGYSFDYMNSLICPSLPGNPAIEPFFQVK